MPTRSASREQAADAAAVEALRQKCGDQEAAKLAADLYKLRRTPSRGIGSFPLWVAIPLGIWLVAVETAARLPDVLLSVPRYEATRAEYEAKKLQPLIAVAELEKAQSEAKAASFQPALTASQAAKAEMDAAYGQYSTGITSARLGNMFDILDPDHLFLVAQGTIDPMNDSRYLSILASLPKRK
jgi:hypothetical protein